jgi:hypothetical protein
MILAREAIYAERVWIWDGVQDVDLLLQADSLSGLRGR